MGQGWSSVKPWQICLCLQWKCELWQRWLGCGKLVLSFSVQLFTDRSFYRCSSTNRTPVCFCFPVLYGTSLAETVWGFHLKPAHCFIRMPTDMVTRRYFVFLKKWPVKKRVRKSWCPEEYWCQEMGRHCTRACERASDQDTWFATGLACWMTVANHVTSPHL